MVALKIIFSAALVAVTSSNPIDKSSDPVLVPRYINQTSPSTSALTADCPASQIVSVANPPSGAVCGITGSSLSSNTLFYYTGDYRVSSVENCILACLAFPGTIIGCGKIQYIQDSFCALLSIEPGLGQGSEGDADTINYDLRCFACATVEQSSTSTAMAVPTSSSFSTLTSTLSTSFSSSDSTSDILTSSSFSSSSPVSTVTTASSVQNMPPAATTCSVSQTVPGYNEEWRCLDAAADGNGYLSAYVSSSTTYSDAVVDCASSCSSNTDCAFFNVYQEQSSTPADIICVLWNQDKPITSATNTYNRGKPVTDSAGYFKTNDYIVSGYSEEWTGQNAAADGSGYISSYISGSTAFDDVVNECAGSCTAYNSCAFFNVYEEPTVPDIICVLWSQDKPLSSATNVENGGKPVTNSTGYLKTAGPSQAGYDQEWSNQTGAADGPGYISSYISAQATFDDAVSDCVASCSLEADCVFINVYQEPTVPDIICVLWRQNKPITSATNFYNNGKPISNSVGYQKSAQVAGTSQATI